MSNPAIPKEQLTAYERWELPNFGSSGMHDSASIGCQDNPDISLPTAAELEAIQRQAHEEGYQAGYAEGYQTGNAEGTQAGNTETSRRCTELMDSMAQALQQADQDIAQDLLKLSLEVARQMVQQTLKSQSGNITEHNTRSNQQPATLQSRGAFGTAPGRCNNVSHQHGRTAQP
jgi:flagellar assembly protein FliH